MARNGIVALGLRMLGLRMLGLGMLGLGVMMASAVWGAEPPSRKVVTFKSFQGQKTSIGEVITEYADGSMLFLTPDGQLWTIQADDVLEAKETDAALVPMTSEEIYAQFKEQLPAGFLVYKTKHYVLVYNTSDIYVKWVGELFERLYRRFYNYWKKRGLVLEEPRFPLVAVVFSDKTSYLAYAERDIGKTAQSMIGYYNMKTNRMSMYDLTGVDGLVPNGQRVRSQAVINQILSRPQAERTVATIVHESVHQLAFNSGMQVRLADNPLWYSEGMAMFFESPDRGKQSGGWKTVGAVNYHNLRLFAQYLPRRPADSLTSLITDDSRLQQAETATQAYPESWALTYFLLKTKSKQYVAYTRELAKLPSLGESTPRERIDLFKKHFGDDLGKIDRDFIKYMRRVR